MDYTSFQTFSEVTARQKGNPATRWHRPGADANDADGNMAFQRLGREFFRPWIKPSFQVGRDATFFMMGSCFARGLERALSNQGLSVRSLSTKFDEFTAVSGSTPLGATNRYNSASILNEFKWALDPASPFPELAIIDLNDGTAVDPHMNPALALVDRQGTLIRRAIFQEVAQELANVDVVILTLGLLEVWVDRELGLVMNAAPQVSLTRQHPDRFVFGRLRYGDNLANMNEIHALLQKFGKPGHRIVVTVSPVPLAATFANEDVVSANTYSKSVLRAVANDFADNHENVDYFPSYEMVMNSSFDTSWIEDKRHPQGKLGGHIMRTFVKNYVQGIDAHKVDITQQYVV